MHIFSRSQSSYQHWSETQAEVERTFYHKDEVLHSSSGGISVMEILNVPPGIILLHINSNVFYTQKECMLMKHSANVGHRHPMKSGVNLKCDLGHQTNIESILS